MVEADAGEGVARVPFCENLSAAQGEVADRVVLRVVHEDQVGEPIFRQADSAEVHVGPDISVDHQEGFIAEQRQRPKNASPRLKGPPLGRVPDLQPPRRPVPQRMLDLVPEMGVVDHEEGDPRRRQALDEMDNQRLAAGLQQGLGSRVRQWAKALAATGGKNHRTHGASIRGIEGPASAPHRIEELAVRLGCLELVVEEFHGGKLVHRVQDLAQDPHLLKLGGVHQELLTAGA
jgi:hypothetical protein